MYTTKYYDLAITYSVVLRPVYDLRWIIYFGWTIYVLTGYHMNASTGLPKYDALAQTKGSRFIQNIGAPVRIYW